jgi:hypothetical protein
VVVKIEKTKEDMIGSDKGSDEDEGKESDSKK